MLAIDLGVFNRKPHEITTRNAALWSAVWITLAIIFAGLLFGPLGWELFGAERGQKALEFVTGYLIELSLSVDNLFVFLIIFSYFKVPPKYQHRVLYWGVLGALVMRVTMIFVGTAIINRFHAIIYVFGAFLVYTGFRMLFASDDEANPEDRPIVRWVTRIVPIARHYERRKFFTVVDGKRVGTLLLLVLIVVEVTGLVFAVDSIPAIFGVTTDRFIVYTSNVFAILGLRTFYFLLAGVVEKFHYLKIGLGIVLAFIGVKMLLPLISGDLPRCLARWEWNRLRGMRTISMKFRLVLPWESWWRSCSLRSRHHSSGRQRERNTNSLFKVFQATWLTRRPTPRQETFFRH